jgi:hypothetical protein
MLANACKQISLSDVLVKNLQGSWGQRENDRQSFIAHHSVMTGSLDVAAASSLVRDYQQYHIS